jgi:hypothetical protein
MTLGITQTNITQVDGRRVSGRSSRRKPILIIGPVASTATLAANTGKRVTTTAEVVTYCAHGPLAEAACDSITHENRVAIIMPTASTGTAGAYVSVDDDGMTDDDAPVIAGDTTVLPEDDLEPGVEFVAGGIVGTTGITYKYRTGGALSASLSGVQALGTATSITLPLGAGKYNILPNEAQTVAYLNDLVSEFQTHTDYLTGTVHGAVDPATYVIGTATTFADSYAVFTSLRTSAIAHVGVVGTTHGAADTTASTAITAIAVPATPHALVTALLAFKLAFFGTSPTVDSGHTQRTAGTVHGGQDAANLPTATVASHGIIAAGDSFTAITSAPRWSIAELGAALDEVLLLPASLDYDGILLCGPVLTKVEADAIATKVEALRTKARWRRLQPHFRMREDGESLTDYRDDFETAFGTVEQRSLHGAAVSWYVQSSHPSRFGQVDARPFSFAYFGRLCTLKPDINPTDETDPPNGFGSFTRGYVRDPANPKNILPRAVDDGHTELFTPLRAVAPRTKNQVSEGIVYPGQGAMFAPANSDFYIAPYARGIDEGCNVAFRPLEVRLGRKVLEAPDHTIDPNERKRIESGITQDCEGPLVKTGIARSIEVLLDPDALLNTPPPVVVGATIKMNMDGYIDEWDVDISLT